MVWKIIWKFKTNVDSCKNMQQLSTVVLTEILIIWFVKNLLKKFCKWFNRIIIIKACFTYPWLDINYNIFFQIIMEFIFLQKRWKTKEKKFLHYKIYGKDLQIDEKNIYKKIILSIEFHKQTKKCETTQKTKESSI